MKVLRYGSSFYKAPTGVGYTNWPFHDFFMLLSGEMLMDADGSWFHVHGGDILLFPPRVTFHSPKTYRSSLLAVLHFEASPCGEASVDSLLTRREPTLFKGSLAHPQISRVMQRIAELFSPQRREEDEFLLSHLLATFLAELMHLHRHPGLMHPHGHLIRETCLWAEKHIGEVRTVGTLAQRAEMSESHFRAVFRKIYGVTAGNWLTQARITEARRLLSGTNTPIKEIALTLGYAEVEVFHRAFARVAGQTPAQYRRQNPPLI